MSKGLTGIIEKHTFEACWRCNRSVELNQIFRCPKCEGSFHSSCVKRTGNLKEWMCPNCSKVVRELPNGPQQSEARKVDSRKSRRSSKSSNKSSIEDQLRLLEEQKTLLDKQFHEKERQMADKHKQEQQLLSEKMKLLRENQSCSSRSSESTRSLEMSKDRVDNWNTFEPNVVQKPASTMQSQHIVKPPLPSGLEMNERVGIAQNFQQSALNQPALQSITHISSSGLAARHVMGRRLTSFDGDPMAWSGFISQFETSTKACELTNAENLVRLDECLKGNARAAVEGLLYLPENVPTIMIVLRRLFGRPEFVVNALITKIQSSGPKTLSLENFEEIIAFSTQVSNVVTHMKQALMSDYLWNPFLMQQLIDKLPCQFKVDWAAFRSNLTNANLEVFSSWLEEKSLSLTFVLTKPPQFSKQKSSKAYIQIHSQGSPPKCMICENSCPSIADCLKFKDFDYETKWEKVHSNRLCRICLKPHQGRCKSGKRCGSPGCTFMHNTLLHKPKDDVEVVVEEEIPAAPINVHKSIASTLFKIVPVKLFGKSGKMVTTFALIDDGSALTLMEEKLANDLELDGPISALCLQWTNEQQRMESNSMKVDLSMSGVSDGDVIIDLRGVHTVTNLSLPSQTVDMKELSKKFSYLKHVPVTSYANARPSILIGLDHPKVGLASKVKCGGEFEPVVISTKLGWIIFGSSSQNTERVLHICDCSRSLEQLDRTVKEFITIDSLGSKNIQPISEMNKRANDIMEQSLKFEDGSYYCNLLWKYDKVSLPNSHKMALKRLDCLQKRLANEVGLRDIMENQLSDYLKKGYIRSVDKEEEMRNSNNCWYLPVFPVRNPNKPNKLRIVWDAAASVDNVSLNSMLLTGPDLLSCLPGVLLRFREKKFAIAGDLMEMFHQIKTAKEDQKFQWFMWKEQNGNVKTFAMTVMTFGAACSPFIAQYVKNHHAYKFIETAPKAVNAITKNHYVDDWLDSFDSEEELISVAREVIDIYKSGGFVIRNWISNSRKVIQSLGGSGLGDESKHLSDLGELKSEKILGLWWNVSKDTFTYSLKFNKGNAEILSGQRMPTKREMLRIIMSVFDPLGFLAHFLIYAKILMQRIWRKAVDWDQVIPADVQPDWLLWVQKLPEIENINIDRWYGVSYNPEVEFELHTFVDASEEAYAAIVYLRVLVGSSSCCRIVSAKSRTAPVKALTIPRLELNAAVLGTRLAISVQKQQTICFTKRYFWSDSRTVICWINSETRNYKQYVSCRVGEILEETEINEWFWISTKKNVADLATRLTLPDFGCQSEWFCGPYFLQLSKEEWPIKKDEKLETDEEIRPRVLLSNHIERLLEYSNFSSYKKLLRRFMSVIRCFKIWKLKANHSTESIPSEFCQFVLKQAEYAIFKVAQQDVYGEEITQLRSNNKISKRSSLYKRMAYLDQDGLLRCTGRIDFSIDASHDTKRPIILPTDHHITNLVILHYHLKFNHHNHETVVNELRQKFSISRLRTQLWKLRSSCQHCKNNLAKPSPPEMGQLPPARLKSFTRPFSYVGIDFFGPITVSIGRRQEKRWGMLMTCLTVRAVHLECVHSLNTSSCILGLRNFINRRGCPLEVYSDNGTNFKGASRELREARSKIDMNQVAKEFLEAAMKWFFIPPASPHMGGAWERLVRSVKDNISYITKSRSFKEEYFISLLIEVENIINSRPLSYIPIDDENGEALTPNHFLLGSSNGNKPVGVFEDNGVLLRNNWHTIQKLANLSWKRWINEGLPGLNLRSKWHSTDASRQLKVDDIVLVFDERSPRCCYPKGRIIDVSVSNDGLVRKATVQTSTGIYERPVVKLAKLDVHKEAILDVPEYLGEEMLERVPSL